MRNARAAVEGAGVARSRVHVEKFVSLSGNPFDDVVDAGLSGPPSPSHTAGGRRSELTVALSGETHTMSWGVQDTLIDVLITNGIDAPYSCREGQCGTCQCVVVEGQVAMDAHGALDEEDIAEGIVLGCQARPASDRILIEF